MSAEPAAGAAEQLRSPPALQGRLLSPKPWFNMSLQGVQPLRQQASQAGAAGAEAWQLQQPGRAGACTAAGAWQPWLQSQVSDETAFEGGSCLRLQGEGVIMLDVTPAVLPDGWRLHVMCGTRVQAGCVSHVSSTSRRCTSGCLQGQVVAGASASMCIRHIVLWHCATP